MLVRLAKQMGFPLRLFSPMAIPMSWNTECTTQTYLLHIWTYCHNQIICHLISSFTYANEVDIIDFSVLLFPSSCSHVEAMHFFCRLLAEDWNAEDDYNRIHAVVCCSSTFESFSLLLFYTIGKPPNNAQRIVNSDDFFYQISEI